MALLEVFLNGKPPLPPRSGKRSCSGFAMRDELPTLLVCQSPLRYQGAALASGKSNLPLDTAERSACSTRCSLTNLLEPRDNVEGGTWPTNFRCARPSA